MHTWYTINYVTPNNARLLCNKIGPSHDAISSLSCTACNSLSVTPAVIYKVKRVPCLHYSNCKMKATLFLVAALISYCSAHMCLLQPAQRGTAKDLDTQGAFAALHRCTAYSARSSGVGGCCVENASNSNKISCN